MRGGWRGQVVTTRKGSAKGNGKGHKRWLFRLVALVVLFALGFAVWLWWDMRSWRPDIAHYPEQGAVVSDTAEQVNFTTLKAVGAQFVYLRLNQSEGSRASGFGTRFGRALGAGMKVGMVMHFNPCLRADPQSAFFTQMVPRNSDFLPPAIELGRMATSCEPRVSDAAVESELMTLINQIEMHTGKPVILKLSREFEARHGTARTTDRDLWLTRDRARPDYAGRPWLLWSANSQLITEASEEPLEWVVVQR